MSSFTETEGPLPSLRDPTGPNVEYPYHVSVRSNLMVSYPSAIFPGGLLPLPWIEELFAHQISLARYGCLRSRCLQFLRGFYPIDGLYSYVIVNAELQNTWKESAMEGLRKTMKIIWISGLCGGLEPGPSEDEPEVITAF